MVKCQPVDLTAYFNAGAANEPLRPGARQPWQPAAALVLDELPAGRQTYWGLPFDLADPLEGGPRWLVVGAEGGPRAAAVPLAGRATYVVVLHFCNVSQDPAAEGHPPALPLGAVVRPGELLADYVLRYADGDEHRQAIRRRFEINDLVAHASSPPFACRGYRRDEAVDFRGPHPRDGWGRRQTGVRAGTSYLALNSRLGTNLWLYALANPAPNKELRELRLEATGADALAVAAITLFEGADHPLRYRRLESLRVSLAAAVAPDELALGADLGVIARQYCLPAFEPERWLAEAVQGWGEEPAAPPQTREVIVDLTATPDATLAVGESQVPLGELYRQGEARSADQRVRVEMLTPQRTWSHIVVKDATTGQPTPVRIHLRAPDGRYFPPHGHRHEVNDNWFEDYGADLKLGSTQYAYIDGRCQGELPVGEVYVEVAKGFEYQPLRQKLEIKPGQREVELQIERPLDWRRRGWVTADTHVHFISPQTAWLEAQAEGVNLVNLLASQWGDLFTNVGDITGDVSACGRDDTVIWVGTENRQHLLGHISLLGGRGQPTYPLCASGPGESYLGDPVWSTLADWADRCRQQDGLVVVPHFGVPLSEAVADVVLGKVDALEIRDFRLPALDSLPVMEWYRFLNCGYRVSAVGGTDKMSAGMPLGGVRTYAFIGDEPFSFASWAQAVRAGRTFTTTGPLLDLRVEGLAPGDTITLPRGGGTFAVEANAESLQPFDELQIVVNGKVVLSTTPAAPGRSCTLRGEVSVGGSAWVAARCSGRGRLWHEWPMHVAAHTSPVYLVAGGQDLFSPADAAFMLTLIEGGLTWLDTLAVEPPGERRWRNRKVLEDARSSLHQRLHEHGHMHGPAR
ncbi:MAG: CehA/McbA family metallohydrolase [Chloroflexota bacterium]